MLKFPKCLLKKQYINNKEHPGYTERIT